MPGTLMVYLDKCTDLANMDVGSKSDPYCKFSLKQDNWILDKNFGKLKTNTVKDNLNPVWAETFAFDVPSLKNLKLIIDIKDDDPIIDDKLGKCTLNLWELGLSETSIEVVRVIDGNLFDNDAKIYLKLSYKEKPEEEE